MSCRSRHRANGQSNRSGSQACAIERLLAGGHPTRWDRPRRSPNQFLLGRRRLLEMIDRATEHPGSPPTAAKPRRLAGYRPNMLTG
jgi:hypothetical protein